MVLKGGRGEVSPFKQNKSNGNILTTVAFKALIPVTMKSIAFCVVLACSSDTTRRFGGT
jgi:hypothetical protein